MTTSEPTNEESKETTTTEYEQQLTKCDYCLKEYKDILDNFSECGHKICPVCLLRRIFILNITDLNGSSDNLTIKCSKCNKDECKMTKNLDELIELSTKKTKIFTNQNEGERNNNNFSSSNICQVHKNVIKHFCLDCCQYLCKKCYDDKNNPHYKHTAMGVDKVISSLNAEIKNIPLSFKSKEEFQTHWDQICKKMKEESQDTFNETMNKIEEVSKMIVDFKKEYEKKYKEELTKIVKTLKVLKLFYFDYYFERDESQKEKDLDSLRYVNSINSELAKLETKKDITYIQKINEAKLIIDNLKKNNKINFSIHLLYNKLKNNYGFESEIKGAHEKFINSVFELRDGKLLTTSYDYSMKIWEEKEYQFNLHNKIDKRCGCVIASLKIEGDKILTSNNSSNSIYIWGQNPKGEYSIESSLSMHSKPVVCMVELENGNLITSGTDKLIIIWNKNEAGFYEGKETITEENIVKKIVALKDNKFGYTGDDGILKIMAKNSNKSNNEEASPNEECKEGETKCEENTNDGNENQTEYKKICELKRHTGKINCMCELKNEYLFTGGANVNKNKDHHIIVWKPDGENGYIYSQTLSGHKVDISDIIQLKDGRVASSSKDRTIIIWKPTFENDDKNTIKYVSDEILTEYTHGMYGLLELKDSRICTITSNNSLIFWRKSGSLPYC